MKKANIIQLSEFHNKRKSAKTSKTLAPQKEVKAQSKPKPKAVAITAITKSQIKQIKTLQGQIKMEDETYRQRLFAEFKTTSCTMLNVKQAWRFIQILQKLGKQQQPKRRRSGRRKIAGVTAIATQPQRDLITQLVKECRWNWQQYHHWLNNTMRYDQVRTAAEAMRVIEGLKILKRKNKY